MRFLLSDVDNKDVCHAQSNIQSITKKKIEDKLVVLNCKVQNLPRRSQSSPAYHRASALSGM